MKGSSLHYSSKPHLSPRDRCATSLARIDGSNTNPIIPRLSAHEIQI